VSKIMMEREVETELALSAFFAQKKGDDAQDLRQKAWEAFQRDGLPNRRVESWHYTDLRGAMRQVAPLAAARGDEPIALAPLSDALRLVVVDGAFRPDLSELGGAPEGVAISSLREALGRADPAVMQALSAQAADAVVALNAALMQDGVVVSVAPGVEVARPIELVTLLSSPQSAFTRSLVIVGEGARATIAEKSEALASPGALENHALVFALGARARVEHIAHVAGGAQSSVRVLSLLATLAEKSALSSFCLIEGGGLLRRQVFAQLDGAEAEAAFNGVSLLRGRDHADTSLFLRHASPGGVSREFFRHIVDGEATGVFQGKVTVLQKAQKTNGAMQSKALLLSPSASMNNKPELEIFADDVVCGHGATCGRLDADQLFYLTARGLPKREAEALLIEGFANEAIAQVLNEAWREKLTARVAAWLSSGETD
jgi:Fe-S cluster assembly protein SufD